MPKLYELLLRKLNGPVVETPVEFKFYNPLNARIGNHVRLDVVELDNFNFTITQLREVNRHIGEQLHQFADYDLLARPYSGESVHCRIRLIPIPNPDSELTHTVVLLRRVAECAYDKEFHDGLAFDVNNGEFIEGDAKYWRVNDMESEWNAETAVLRDADNSGKVDTKEVERRKLTYWDYWRETEDVGGNKVIEFYLVEMDGDTGYFEFWVGHEIDQNRVSVD